MKAGKMLVGFALIWIVLGCVLGFVLGAVQTKYLQNMQEFAQSNNLSGFWAEMSSWKHYSGAHSHGLCLATVAFLIGLAMVAEVIKRLQGVTSWLLAIGTVTMSLGEIFIVVPMMVIGGIMFIIALVLAFIAMWLKPKSSTTAN